MRLRYCPRPPDSVDRADLPRLAETLERGAPAWYRARAYDPGHGSRLGDLHDRHITYRIVEEARQGRAAMSGRAEILKAGFDESRSRDDDPIGARIYVRRVVARAPAADPRPDGRRRRVRAAADESPGPDRETARPDTGIRGKPLPTIWPDAWGERVDVVGLALTAQAWAEA